MNDDAVDLTTLREITTGVTANAVKTAVRQTYRVGGRGGVSVD